MADAGREGTVARGARRVAVAATVMGGAAYGGLHWLGRTAGATTDERRRVLPGDEKVLLPSFVTNHAVTIDAPPDQVWPWLVQMGWHRGGWYTARWVDRALFPDNDPSVDQIVPAFQDLEVGDVIPDGRPEADCYFVVDTLMRERHLVLHSHTHLPPGWAERYGATIDWTWAFVLDPLSGDRTRFLFRSRAHLTPRWVAAAYWSSIVPADFVMARQMLAGVKARAEAPPRAPLHLVPPVAATG